MQFAPIGRTNGSLTDSIPDRLECPDSLLPHHRIERRASAIVSFGVPNGISVQGWWSRKEMIAFFNLRSMYPLLPAYTFGWMILGYLLRKFRLFPAPNPGEVKTKPLIEKELCRIDNLNTPKQL